VFQIHGKNVNVTAIGVGSEKADLDNLTDAVSDSFVSSNYTGLNSSLVDEVFKTLCQVVSYF